MCYLQCVMSRTFGNAAPGGGVGVHMMVPLIDMLNHAGDETESGLLSDEPVATDNVRCECRALHCQVRNKILLFHSVTFDYHFRNMSMCVCYYQ